MSLFSALTVAVGGLNAQSRSIGHISDNISNASTVGFKRIDTEFQSLVTQSTAALSDPGGVRARPAYQNDLQGNLVQSQSATSLAVGGKGFFIVREPVVSSSGTPTFTNENFYTRRGDFRLDKDGYMTNGAGFVMMGYSLNELGTRSDEVEPVQISAQTDKPVATSAVTYKANLPASSPSGTDAIDFSPSTVQIYDNVGSKHTLSFDWQKIGSGTWRLAVNIGDGLANSSFTGFSSGATFTTGSTGTIAASAAIPTQYLDFAFNTSDPAGTINAITNRGSANFFTVTTDTSTGQPATVTFNAKFADAGNQAITLNFGKWDESSGVTQFDSTGLTVSSVEQNGIPQGSFRDLEVDANGFIYANYDNGRSRTLYQVQLAQFNSPTNLQREDGGVFSSTISSGPAITNDPGANGNGKIVANTLEGSNVDIADEFTKMIQAQRIYSANARTITTSNSMLEEVINIVR